MESTVKNVDFIFRTAIVPADLKNHPLAWSTKMDCSVRATLLSQFIYGQ